MLKEHSNTNRTLNAGALRSVIEISNKMTEVFGVNSDNVPAYGDADIDNVLSALQANRNVTPAALRLVAEHLSEMDTDLTSTAGQAANCCADDIANVMEVLRARIECSKTPIEVNGN